MFVGHYAAALAARAAEPRAPLWSYVLGCQALDIGWSVLVMTGVERLRVDPSLPGSALILDHMPFTHSLPAAILWSVAIGLLLTVLLKLPRWAGVMVGLTVFSHWAADFLVHRPDLELWFGGAKVGLGWWNYPVAEQALEMGLLAMAGSAWGWRRAREGRAWWPAPLFLCALLALQVFAMLSPAEADPVALGGKALAVYLALVAAAWLTELKPARS